MNLFISCDYQRFPRFPLTTVDTVLFTKKRAAPRNFHQVFIHQEKIFLSMHGRPGTATLQEDWKIPYRD
jgi:hypothetical protein